jgi:cytochrome P450
MIAAAERTRDRWLHRGDAPLDVGHEMMRTTFDIIVETMMSGGHGIHVDRVEQSITDYLTPSGWTFALALAAAPQWVPYPGRRRANSAVSFMRSSLAAVVAKRRAGGSARQDMISMLLAARDPESDRAMSDDEIIDNLMTFITAGHETTALGLAWTFHLLAQNPHHEEKVLEEIAAVTGGAPVRAEHVGELAYTKQVFSEAMRLYPPAPIIARTASREFDLGGYMVPKGATLYVPIYAVHRHASVWTDPERFDPDRFSPEAAKDRHRYAYLPFGAGPRVCIGNVFASMEAVAILAVLLQTFRLTSRDAAAPQPVMKVTLRPNRPLLMDASVRRPAPDRPATPNGS